MSSYLVTLGETTLTNLPKAWSTPGQTLKNNTRKPKSSCDKSILLPQKTCLLKEHLTLITSMNFPLPRPLQDT